MEYIMKIFSSCDTICIINSSFVYMIRGQLIWSQLIFPCLKWTIEWRRARVSFLMKLQDLRPEDMIVAGGFGDWWTMALIFECDFLVSFNFSV